MRNEETRRTLQLKPSFKDWQGTEVMKPISSLGRDLVSKAALNRVGLSVQLDSAKKASNFSAFLKQSRLMPPKPQALFSKVRDKSSVLNTTFKNEVNPLAELEETFDRVREQF